MVQFLLNLIAPLSRLWIIGQTLTQAGQDKLHLLLRTLLLTAATTSANKGTGFLVNVELHKKR